jgi:Icc-related predicted phosphoesterase
VRDAIEKYNPFLTLVGHIHESDGIVEIGRTTVVNSGSAYWERMLREALIDILNGSVLNCRMIYG